MSLAVGRVPQRLFKHLPLSSWSPVWLSSSFGTTTRTFDGFVTQPVIFAWNRRLKTVPSLLQSYIRTFAVEAKSKPKLATKTTTSSAQQSPKPSPSKEHEGGDESPLDIADPPSPGAVASGKTRANKRRVAAVHPKLSFKDSFPVIAYATCAEFDLEQLHAALLVQDLYIPTVLTDDMDDVIHTVAKYKISDEPREIFFFREGAVVCWNMPELECLNVLQFLKKYEHERYATDQVTQELEYMRYCYTDQGASRLLHGMIALNATSHNSLYERYTFANAMAYSVKLGILESTLDNFVESITHITDALKHGDKLDLSRPEVLKKTGELYSLRHELNLNSDLLDTPDFYWERENLESLYHKACNYLNMARRTKILNEKMTQCSELLELINTHLNDKHHIRLEWMIILLIMVEVGFEILHFAERFWT